MLKIDELEGVLPALVTPLNEDGSADAPGIGRVVEHVLAGGVHGILALGSTGEGASIEEPVRRRALAGVVEAAAGRVPVICGVAQPHLAAAIAEVRAAAQLGAEAALVAPPFYYPVDQPTVLAFYRRLAAASPVPILVYNIPQFTKVVAQPATVATLAREGAIAGIKDSSRDFGYFQAVCVATRELPAFRAFTGTDGMLAASLGMGGAGTICASANIAPRWVVGVFEAFRSGDWAAARRGQDLLIELGAALATGVFPAAFKAALHLQGVCQPWPAPPLAPLDKESQDVLKERLEAWGLLTAGGVTA